MKLSLNLWTVTILKLLEKHGKISAREKREIEELLRKERFKA